jgi:hydroxymethylpyrimidine/phosphomethylpyrimidine kinase
VSPARLSANSAAAKIKAGELTLEQKVPVSELAHAQPPSKIGVPAGKSVGVNFAIQALLVHSANDMAYVLAEAASGSIAAFSAEMNPQARKLGMTGSHFVNPNGLFDHRHISTARDIAMAAEALEVPYVLVTGIPLPDQYIDNVLASTETVIGSSKFEMFDGSFHGAGDTLSAALTALLAAGNDLGAAAQDALEYLDHSLGSGFRPGMGQLIPDRMFWAQPDEAAEAAESDEDSAQPPTDAAPPADDEPPPLEGFEMHPHDTKH